MALRGHRSLSHSRVLCSSSTGSSRSENGTTVRAFMPCLRALRQTFCFPCGDVGPVLRAAFLIFAAICAALAMVEASREVRSRGWKAFQNVNALFSIIRWKYRRDRKFLPDSSFSSEKEAHLLVTCIDYIGSWGPFTANWFSFSGEATRKSRALRFTKDEMVGERGARGGARGAIQFHGGSRCCLVARG